jgi:hypothetical protein
LDFRNSTPIDLCFLESVAGIYDLCPMKVLVSLIAVLFLFCFNPKGEENDLKFSLNDDKVLLGANDTNENRDTLFYYDQRDDSVVDFDTLISDTHYYMKFYCLNDSLVFNETFSEKRNENKNLIEIAVAHNYVADFVIQRDGYEFPTRLTKYQFKDSLSDDFIEIATIWKNEFEYVAENKPVFRATIAKPDTGYQYSVLYTVSKNNQIEIIQVDDENN